MTKRDFSKNIIDVLIIGLIGGLFISVFRIMISFLQNNLKSLIGPLFTKGIEVGKDIYQKLNIAIYIKVAIPFLITILVLYFIPALFGSGQDLLSANLLEIGNVEIFKILILKFLLMVIAFSSGIPGGVFFPMITIGSLLGTIYGKFLCSQALIGQEHILLFLYLGMAGYFVSNTRSPIIAIVITMEFTGSYKSFAYIILTVLIAYSVSKFINLKPIYEMF